ncbi:MAG: type IX secretion system protein PorQ [Crocinitomicaceae bacterium]|nr:type IX secretion system protein PorQ [Crocinitomicaceae bacterium]
MKKIVFLLLLVYGHSYAQQGGLHTFQFLDLDFNTRSMSMAGDFITANDGDIDLSVSNPSVINEQMHNHLSLNHFFYPSGINYGQIAYGRSFDKVGTFVGHLRYVNYGRFTRTDATGVEQGNFTAGDYALGVGYGYQLNKLFSIGANFNMIFSHLETYTSLGVGVDIAANFKHDPSNITASIVARNVGWQMKGYTSKNHEPLPIEVLAGISYKFHHAPFRLSLVGTDLTNWDLTYSDPSWQPTIDQLTGDTIPVPESSWIAKFGYHMNVGLEIVPKSERFFVRSGFNFQRRDALGVSTRKGIGGFSFGFGMRLKKFSFNYGISFYSAAGIVNSFSFTSNLDEWRRTKKSRNQPDQPEP